VKHRHSDKNGFSIYAGLDWGTTFKRACVLDASGKILRECRIDHSGQAIKGFLRDLTGLVSGKPDSVAVTIEVLRGPVVEASWKVALRCSLSTPSS